MTPLADKVRDRLYRFTDYQSRRKAAYTRDNFNLDRIHHLLELLSHPEKQLKIIHIAGTKGKGSVAAMLHQAFFIKGMRSGLYTSPHVLEECERIMVDKVNIPWEALNQGLDEIAQKQSGEGSEATLFDIYTAVSLWYFRKMHCEWAILETGLGGRLDSTNFCSPELTIITSIGFDHTDRLGNTIEKIASEKAGIIKKNRPTITSPQKPEAMRVIENKCREQSSSLYKVHSQEDKSIAQVLCEKAMSVLALPLSKEQCLQVPAFKLPGRLQYLPPYLVDGAHNPMAFQYLLEWLKTQSWYKDYQKTELFIYCLPDKDFGAILELVPSQWDILYCQLHLDFLGEEQIILDKDREQFLCKDWKRQFKNEASDVLKLATGSFYMAKEALSILSASYPDRS